VIAVEGYAENSIMFNAHKIITPVLDIPPVIPY